MVIFCPFYWHKKNRNEVEKRNRQSHSAYYLFVNSIIFQNRKVNHEWLKKNKQKIKLK